MMDRVLVTLKLREPLGVRQRRVVESIDPRLITIANLFGLALFGLDCENFPAWATERPNSFGVYYPLYDAIYLNTRRIALERGDVNNTLAHEILHATGHPIRLKRRGLKLLGTTPEEYNEEECVAQYGARLLLHKLGLGSTRIEDHTEEYLMAYGQKDGQPTAEQRMHAIRAVKLILIKFEDFKNEGKEAA